MKSLLLILSLSILGGVMPPSSFSTSIQNSIDPLSSNATIYVDNENVNYELIRNIHDNSSTDPDVDFIGSDSSLNIIGSLPAFNEYYIDGNNRTIIGFDAPELKTIDRLTFNIKYRMYKNWDVFKWFPELFQSNFVINGGYRYLPYGSTWMANVTGETDRDVISCPNIGNFQDLVDLENRFASLTSVNSGVYQGIWSPSQYKYFIDDNRIGDNVKAVSLSGLVDRSFYVILPMSFTYEEVWISVSGTKQDNTYVSDGLDSSGVPYTHNVDGDTYKYIDIGFDSVRSVFFTHRTTITSIVVSGDDVGGYENQPYLRFGDYDFLNNVFNILIKEFWITDSGRYINTSDNQFIVLPGYDAVLSFIPEGDFSIRISYFSEGAAVYQNIVDADGVENPITNDPTSSNNPGWGWPEWPGFPNLDSIYDVLLLILRIVLVVGALACLVWFITIVAKSTKSKKKGGKK